MSKDDNLRSAAVLQLLSAASGTALWYCCDDTLAAHIGNPGIGTIPIWCIFLLVLIFEGYSPDLGQWRAK